MQSRVAHEDTLITYPTQDTYIPSMLTQVQSPGLRPLERATTFKIEKP
jgi:hypothetical protein